MDIFNIASISLQDMLLIQAISETESVSKAAASVRITQPTASYRLNKLREMFDDQIFVSINRRMHPTPIGIDIIKTFNSQIASFNALIEPESFDPQTTHRTFTIISKGSFLPWALVSLSESFFQQTTSAKLMFEPVETDLSINQQLRERGDAFSWTFDPVGAAGIRRFVTPEMKVLIHYDPRFRDPPTTIDEFYKCRFIMLGSALKLPGAVDIELGKRGYKPRQPACVAPTVESIAQLLVGTDLVYCGTNLFTKGFITGLEATHMPFDMAGLRHEIRWNIEKEQDEAGAWFINLVKRHAEKAVPNSVQVDLEEKFVILTEYETLEDKR